MTAAEAGREWSSVRLSDMSIRIGTSNQGIGLAAAVALCLVAHVAVVINYIRAVPVFDWPDAPAHGSCVRSLAAGRFPGPVTDASWDPVGLEALKRTHFRGISRADDPALAAFTYENTQPPLYYCAAAVAYRLGGGLTGVRTLNVVLSCIGLMLLVALARKLFPRCPVVIAGTAVLGALHPMRAYIAGSIGNDPLSEVIFTAFALALIRDARPWVVGLLAGLGLLTKVHLGLLVPLYALFILMDGRKRGAAAVGAAATVAGVAVLVAMPMIWRNIALYGWLDPLGLRSGSWGSAAAELAASGQARPTLTWVGTHGLWAFVKTLFESWWGVFGWMSMSVPGRIYGCYVALTLLALAGLGRLLWTCGRRRLLASHAVRAVTWLLLALGAMAGALVVYSINDYQPQGRYLLTVFAGPALLAGLGWRGFPARLRWLCVAGVGVLLCAMNLYICYATIPWYLSR